MSERPWKSFDYKDIAAFTEAMKSCFENEDTEMAHVYADELMCELLGALGYGQGAEVFMKAEKWYA